MLPVDEGQRGLAAQAACGSTAVVCGAAAALGLTVAFGLVQYDMHPFTCSCCHPLIHASTSHTRQMSLVSLLTSGGRYGSCLTKEAYCMVPSHAPSRPAALPSHRNLGVQPLRLQNPAG